MRRLVSGLLFAAYFTGAATAQNAYPNRTVKIIVPNTPGGVTDTLARVIGQSLSESWGQTVVVENRPGADDMIGTDAVAKSAPDGYTLLVTSGASLTAAPHLHKQMRYDPMKDLTPLVMLGQVTPVVNVPASSPVKTVQDLIALTKEKPGLLNYGSMGNGTYAHVAMEDFKSRTGASLVHIPYKGGAPAVTALLQNEIGVLIINLNSVAEFEKAGKIRVIAAAGQKRASSRPELPTVAETVPGFSTGSWWGLLGPANLPAFVVEKIRADVNRSIDTPQMRKIFEINTLERMTMPSSEFAQFLRNDLDIWGRQIKAAGIEPD